MAKLKKQILASPRPKSIAIFRALFLGDLLCSIPAIKALRNKFPHSKITLIGLPWAKKFTQRFPKYFDNFLEFPGYPGLPEQVFRLNPFIAFLKKVNREKFDLVLQMQGNGSIVNPLVTMLGAKITAGYFKKDEYCPNPDSFLLYPENKHEIERHLGLMEFLGIKSLGNELEYPLYKKDYEDFELLKKELRIRPNEYILLHPGAKDPRRRWQSENFALLSDYFSALGFQIIVSGIKEEKEIVEKIKKTAKKPFIDVCGKINLGTTGVLAENALLIISNDTGISHIASALKKPSITIFSPFSEIERWAPFNKKLHKTINPEESRNPDNIVKKAMLLLNVYKNRVTFTNDQNYLFLQQ